MAGQTAGATGTIIIGDPQTPDFTIIINPLTAAITQSVKNKVVLAPGAALTIPLSDLKITQGTFLWVRGVKQNATDTPQAFALSVHGATFAMSTSEVLHVNNGGALKFSTVIITADATNTTIIEYVIAG